MLVAVDDAPPIAGIVLGRLRAAIPVALLALLLVLVALQRGGYYAESWGVPTIVCGWVVALVALLSNRQRLRRMELVQLASFAALGALTLLSAVWAPGGLGSALPQAQLLALDVAALAAVLMLFRRGTPLLATIWCCLVAICVLALASRLFPDSVTSDTIDGNRLSQPLGYWNSLGVWAAMGLLLAIVLAGRARSITLRAAAAAGCVPCAATLYFTYSRGAWIALAIGLLAAIAVDPRRLGLAAWVLLLAPWPAIGVILASRAHGLTSVTRTLEQARHDGRSLAGALVILSLVAALAAVALAHFERRWRVPALGRRAFACFLIGACALGLAGVMVRFGAPWTIVTKVAHRFDAPPSGGGDLNKRLFDLSSNGRIDLWRVAWHDAERHPLVGSGAGSYESEWFRNRSESFDSTNAHQLYLETLAELGPLGLALLLVALGAPLVAAWRARRHPLAAGATAAYVAFLVHVAVDWDWQLAAVSLAALSSGAALLVMARGSRSPPPGTRARAASAVAGIALAGFALWSLHASSYPLGQARDAMDDGQWVNMKRHAADAAARIGGSSALPWQLLGEAQTALRKPGAARVSLRIAVRRDPSSWEAWYDLATWLSARNAVQQPGRPSR